MINLSKILSPELTVCNSADITSKKQALETISKMVYDIDHAIKYHETLGILQQRERLGSTAIGHGIAIPHGRIPNLEHPVCILISLEKAIEFDPSNTVAVDLIFGLLVPKKSTEEHLQILAAITQKLQSKTYREALRTAKTNDALYQAAISEDTTSSHDSESRPPRSVTEQKEK